MTPTLKSGALLMWNNLGLY